MQFKHWFWKMVLKIVYLRHTHISMSFDGWQAVQCSACPINDLLLGLWCDGRCWFGRRLLFSYGRFSTQCRCTFVMVWLLLLSLSQFMIAGCGSGASGCARLNALLWFYSDWTVFRLVWFITIGSCFCFMGTCIVMAAIAAASNLTSTIETLKWRENQNSLFSKQQINPCPNSPPPFTSSSFSFGWSFSPIYAWLTWTAAHWLGQMIASK